MNIVAAYDFAWKTAVRHGLLLGFVVWIVIYGLNRGWLAFKGLTS